MPTAATQPEATKEHAAPIAHRAGCPRERIESFELSRPRSAQYPLGGRVLVTRCVDCGRDHHADVKETDGG